MIYIWNQIEGVCCIQSIFKLYCFVIRFIIVNFLRRLQSTQKLLSLMFRYRVKYSLWLII